MIQLLVYAQEDTVVWTLVALRPAHEWRTKGSRYWERRGEISLDEPAESHRQLISAALQAVQDRLGER